MVVPLHPRTRAALKQIEQPVAAGVQIVEPLGFLDMQRLEMDARVIATIRAGCRRRRSGRRPMRALREETERVELTEWARTSRVRRRTRP